MDEQFVSGRLILTGKLKLTSPLIIGSGRQDNANIEIMRDVSGAPFIPATSFIGVLRQLTKNNAGSDLFWGKSATDNNDDGVQSALICRDLTLTSGNTATINIRDGVSINSKTGIAIEGKKYDYETVEPCVKFDLYMEVAVRGDFKKNSIDFKNILSKISYLLKTGRVMLGAKTSSGFGRCRLLNQKYFEFNFKNRVEDVIRWLKKDFSQPIKLIGTFSEERNDFAINALFAIKNSLIVRSYSSEPDKPDSVHITSCGKNILPGTSIKGAVRHRAIRILNSLIQIENLETLESTDGFKKLFGFVDENSESEENNRKSRVIIEETEVTNPALEIQTRIKIDRFTGGTVQSALLETMPLWGDNGTDRSVRVKITIKDYDEHEAGLMMLVLKDLWNADLPIGGEKSIGRGVLNGMLARIKWRAEGEDKSLTIENNGENGISFSDINLAEMLNEYSKGVSDAEWN